MSPPGSLSLPTPLSIKELDGISSCDPARLLHVPVHAEDHLGPDPPIAGQHLQDVGILHSGVGVKCRHDAAWHAVSEADDSHTEPDAAALPGVLAIGGSSPSSSMSIRNRRGSRSGSMPRLPTSATEASETIEARCLPPAYSGSSARRSASVSSTAGDRVSERRIDRTGSDRPVEQLDIDVLTHRQCAPLSDRTLGKAHRQTLFIPTPRRNDRHQRRLRDAPKPPAVGAGEQESPIANGPFASKMYLVRMVKCRRLDRREVETSDRRDRHRGSLSVRVRWLRTHRHEQLGILAAA